MRSAALLSSIRWMVDEDATKIDLNKLELEKTGYKLAEDVESGIIKADGKKFYAEVYVQAK